jgi:hypothetical protein
VRGRGARGDSVTAAAALGDGAAARGALLHGVQVAGGGRFDPLRHRRVREATAIVRGDVRARRAAERESEGKESETEANEAHGDPAQLFGAPADAHAARSAEAALLELGPLGGMFPPSQLRHDCAGSASGAFVARM